MALFIHFIERYWQSISLVVLTLITVGSLSPAEHLPPTPGSDKTHHFVGYCLLMLPAAIRRPKHWVIIAILFVCWSGLIEIIQPYVNRYGEWLDMAANTGGIVLAIVIAQCLHYFMAKK